MNVVAWPCPAPGGTGEELALLAGPETGPRLLIVPALFEEANRTRRLLAQTMRALAAAGAGSVLPDLPGCHESLAPLELQTVESWQDAIVAATGHFAVSHVLALRGGAMLAPTGLPGWRLAPLAGAAALRQLLRARTIAASEAGQRETAKELQATGRRDGLELAGYRLGGAMLGELEAASALRATTLADLTLSDVGGSALWLRSEPGEDAAMAAALADLIAARMRT